MTDEYTCPACGWLVDTAEHQLGCEVGRRQVVATDGEGYERGAAGYWHRRYDEQHRTLHRLEDELSKARGEYRQLQELTGGAIHRAHVMRGNRELEVAQAREAADAFARVLQDYLDTQAREVLARYPGYGRVGSADEAVRSPEAEGAPPEDRVSRLLPPATGRRTPGEG